MRIWGSNACTQYVEDTFLWRFSLGKARVLQRIFWRKLLSLNWISHLCESKSFIVSLKPSSRDFAWIESFYNVGLQSNCLTQSDFVCYSYLLNMNLMGGGAQKIITAINENKKCMYLTQILVIYKSPESNVRLLWKQTLKIHFLLYLIKSNEPFNGNHSSCEQTVQIKLIAYI